MSIALNNYRNYIPNEGRKEGRKKEGEREGGRDSQSDPDPKPAHIHRTYSYLICMIENIITFIIYLLQHFLNYKITSYGLL